MTVLDVCPVIFRAFQTHVVMASSYKVRRKKVKWGKTATDLDREEKNLDRLA